MNICFVVENSLPMVQKTSTNDITVFDQVKYSLEAILKSLFQNLTHNFQQSRDFIHLFVTSSTEPIASYDQNHYNHLINQIKNIECTIPTFPAEVIESALIHLGKFRCLNESETLLGYRQGKIFEPAIIFYITGNSNCRQITKIHRKLIQNKLQMRSEYKFVTIKYCSPSPTETNLNTIEKYKSFIQKQKESRMMDEVIKKLNGSLYHVFQPEDLINLVQSIIVKFNPCLTMALTNKEYKIYNKEIVKIQFSSPSAEQNYMQTLLSLKDRNLFIEESQRSCCDIFVDTIPLQRSTQIPLPHELTPRHLNENTIVIEEFQSLKFYVDFSKQYVGDVDPLMKYLFNGYQIVENKKLANIFKDLGQQKKFPLFYQRKKSQYLIGFLRFFNQTLPNKLTRPAYQLYFSFSNFLNLNSNIRSYKQRHPSSEQYFQNYISTLPLFYHKFLSFYLSSLNIILSPQSQQMFGDIRTLPVGVTNWRFYEQRLAEKKTLQILQKKNYEEHQKSQSLCCGVYSSDFGSWEKQRSKFYAKHDEDSLGKEEALAKKKLQQNFSKLQQLKSMLGIEDYLTVSSVRRSSMKKQIEKYNIRRDGDEMDEIVGDYLGNPFKKINKKVKINDEAESVWVEPQQVPEMKQLLAKQMEVFQKISTHLSQSERRNFDKILESENIYDGLAGIKEIIANGVKRIESFEKINQNGLHKQKTQEQTSKETSHIIQIQELDLESQELKVLQRSEEAIKSESQKLDDNSSPLAKDSQQQDKFYKKDERRGQDMQKERNQIPEIMIEINQKFKMNKSVDLSIPASLICKDLYLRNKAIINDVLSSLSNFLKK